jgi:hypothetical protein
MACNVFDGLASATESLSNEVYGRLQPTSLWMNLVPRAPFPNNTGLEQTSFRQGNIEPPDTSTWVAEALTSEENVAGACANDVDDVTWGYDNWIWAPEKKRFKGPLLCKEQFNYEHQPDKWLNGYIGRLSMFSDRVMSFRLQEHYLSLSNKYIAGNDVIIPGSYLPPGQSEATLPAIQPTSQITQSMLDQISLRLNEAGASEQTDPTSYGYYNYGQSGPVYTLYIGQEASQQIVRNDPFLARVNNFSDMGKGDMSQLRLRLASAREYFSFKHVINMIPPRYNWNGSALVRVPVYINVANTGAGESAVFNPDWQTAEFEAAFVLHPLVMTDHPIEPQVNAGGLPFDPINYMGEWQFVVGGYKLGIDCPDPLDDFGQHWSTFKHAIEPVNPDYGYTILFKRCPANVLTVACS